MIYCINARSLKSANKGSTVAIRNGELGMTHVTFQLKSSRGHGLEYKLEVYANTTYIDFSKHFIIWKLLFVE